MSFDDWLFKLFLASNYIPRWLLNFIHQLKWMADAENQLVTAVLATFTQFLSRAVLGNFYWHEGYWKYLNLIYTFFSAQLEQLVDRSLESKSASESFAVVKKELNLLFKGERTTNALNVSYQYFRYLGGLTEIDHFAIKLKF